MPRGPQGQRRPADMVGCAITDSRIAIGEVAKTLHSPSGKIRSGRAGVKARANKLSPTQRSDIAKKAAAARWSNPDE
jgi:hypothetical protein